MNQQKNIITPKQANILSNLFVEALYNESANILNKVCEGFGMNSGTNEEAFESRRNYVNARIRHFKPNEIYELAKRMEGKYPFSELDNYLCNLNEIEELNIVSKFSDIQNSIIQEIRKANYIIWVAVAWFSNRKLANELFLKSKEGVNVQIIISDDEINRTFAIKLEKHFKVLKAEKTEVFENLMHHKFCLIDFKKVVHGSYNWSNKAEYNDETISIIEDKESAIQFANEFMSLKKKIIKDYA